MCYNTPLGLKSPLKQSHNYVGLLRLGFGSGSPVTSDPDAMKNDLMNANSKLLRDIFVS